MADLALGEGIRSPTLRAAVAERLAGAIAAGTFPEGSALPAEPELCRQFGVSRTVVREALGTLEARGLVEVQHGRGAFVLPTRAPAVSALLRFEWQAGRGTPAHLLEARRVLEESGARFAGARATPADLQAMETALAEMAGADTPERYIMADLAFHEAIVRAAANPILTLLNDALADLLRTSRRQTYFLPGAVAHSLRDHRRVYERIAAHDPTGAEREMAAVLDAVEKDITKAGLAPDLQPLPRRAQSRRGGREGDVDAPRAATGVPGARRARRAERRRIDER